MRMDDINKRFGKRLRQLRKDHKMTQEELAQASGVDYKYIQRLEGSNPSSPTLKILEKLARGLKVDLSKLLKL